MFFVNVSVADLRATPNIVFPNDYTHQDGRLTQLTFGDPLVVHKQEGEWLFVSALEQLRVHHKRWEAYPGWLHISEVTSIHSNREKLSFTKKIEEKDLLRESELFIGQPYLWGGCSPPVHNKIAGVDCSGLIYQLFKKQGKLIPRDAHDQYLAAKPVRETTPGDLLFLRAMDKKRISHVVIRYDNMHYLEAPESGKNVRLLRIGSEIYSARGLIHIFDRQKCYFGYCGTIKSAPTPKNNSFFHT